MRRPRDGQNVRMMHFASAVSVSGFQAFTNCGRHVPAEKATDDASKVTCGLCARTLGPCEPHDWVLRLPDAHNAALWVCSRGCGQSRPVTKPPGGRCRGS